MVWDSPPILQTAKSPSYPVPGYETSPGPDPARNPTFPEASQNSLSTPQALASPGEGLFFYLRLPRLNAKRNISRISPTGPIRLMRWRQVADAVPYSFPCTAWNSSLIFMPIARQMRYSVSIEAEFLPSSICER